MRADLLRAQRAVHPGHHGGSVLDRPPEGLHRLPGQGAAAQVDDRHRDPQRQVPGDVTRGRDRGLGVQRVEDRLDQQQVHAALGQRLHLLRVRGVHVVERHRPVRGILHPRGQRQGHVQRADRPGDQAAARLIRRLPGQFGPAQVHLPHQRLQAVVSLADAGRGERVRGGDVGARGQVLAVHLADHIGPGQVQQVRVTGHVLRMITQPLPAVVSRGQPGPLQHRAPGSVEHHDALVQKLAQGPLAAGSAGGAPAALLPLMTYPCGTSCNRRRPWYTAQFGVGQVERGGPEPVAAPLDLAFTLPSHAKPGYVIPQQAAA